MTFKDKILLFVGLGFIGLIVTTQIFDLDYCTPRWKNIYTKLNYMKEEGSIRKIDLFKSAPGYQINLVFDTVTILNPGHIEEIRDIITNRSVGQWNKPLTDWEVGLKFSLTDESSFTMKVKKINNETTYMYFGTTHCYDSLPSSSERLGSLLESLTNYTGRKHY